MNSQIELTIESMDVADAYRRPDRAHRGATSVDQVQRKLILVIRKSAV